MRLVHFCSSLVWKLADKCGVQNRSLQMVQCLMLIQENKMKLHVYDQVICCQYLQSLDLCILCNSLRCMWHCKHMYRVVAVCVCSRTHNHIGFLVAWCIDDNLVFMELLHICIYPILIHSFLVRSFKIVGSKSLN